MCIRDSCEAGYTGSNCSMVDHCANDVCSSPHTIGCINLPDGSGFVCRCGDGWGGEHCDSDIDECITDPGLCHGGDCVNVPGSFRCENCPPNTTGTTCERPVTCADMPCQHGGTCSENGGVPICSCPPKFTGPTCGERGKYTKTRKIVLNATVSCVYGVAC